MESVTPKRSNKALLIGALIVLFALVLGGATFVSTFFLYFLSLLK